MMTGEPQRCQEFAQRKNPSNERGYTATIAALTGLGRALLVLIAITSAACATTGGTPRPRPFPGAPLPPASAPPPPAVGAPVVVPSVPTAPDAIVAIALKLKGVPYRNGGSDPSGFDCSGFVQWVFARSGMRLPREVRDQYGAGKQIDLREVKPGDLLFFETVSRGASHVGLAIGGDQFVHAPSSTGVVRVERFTSSYWKPRFVGARRVATQATKTD
jgi:cell wall-associated NlpC family hydrolase